MRTFTILPRWMMVVATCAGAVACSSSSDGGIVPSDPNSDGGAGATGGDPTGFSTGGASGAGAGTAGSTETAGNQAAGSTGGAGLGSGEGGDGTAGNGATDSGTHGGDGSELGGCSIFSPDDPWRQDVTHMAADANWTAALIQGALKKNLHPDFGNSGTAVYGIPINVVSSSQGKVPVAFDYADESDPGPYPFPSPGAVKIEGGTADNCNGDCHVLVVVQGACQLYEGWDCHYASGWHCGSGAKFDLGKSSYGQRPPRYTSADAAGLAITPGLVRFSEVAAGAVRHAIRFTMHCTQDGFISPASHFAVPTGSGGCPARGAQEAAADYHARLRAAMYPPMGLRIRLKSGYAIAALPNQAQIIARAMQTYGMILADNGSDYYFQGDVDPGWNDELDALKNIPGDAFEVIRPEAIVH